MTTRRVRWIALAFVLGVTLGVGIGVVLQRRANTCSYRETADAEFVSIRGYGGEVTLKEDYTNRNFGPDWDKKVLYYGVVSWQSERYDEFILRKLGALAPLAQGSLPEFWIPREDASPAGVLVYSPQDKTSYIFEVDLVHATVACRSRGVLGDRRDKILPDGQLRW